MTPLIQIRHLQKSFSGQPVLRGIDLNVARGESLVIIGGSGCGKSSLLKHIAGLLQPDSGEVIIDGTDISRLSERVLCHIRKKVGMVFQYAALFDSMTVGENVAFSLREERGHSEQEIRERVTEALSLVRMKGVESKMPSQLSGGMRKRVGLARTLVSRPEIILYDEPTAGLDPIVSDSINKLMKQVNEDLKVTSVVVTHDMKSAYEVADRMVLLHNGQVYAGGTPAEFRDSRDPIISDFVNGISRDNPVMNG